MNNVIQRRKLLQAGLAAPLAGGLAAGAFGQSDGDGSAGKRRIRVAVIGVGGRGKMFLNASLGRDDVDVTALCDIKPAAAAQGVELVRKARGRDVPVYTEGPKDYQRLLKRDDVDAVFVTTPAQTHGPISADGLRADKWVFSEVPACYTLQQCRDLVDAARKSRGKYFLAENYCLFRSNMQVLNMVEKGVFGELTYAECGYIHDCRNIMFDKSGELTWRGQMASDPDYSGNVYPTHSLGPVGTWLGITRGDRFTRCTSLASKAAARKRWVVSKFGADSPQGRIDTWQADSVVSLLNTESGILVVTRKDSASPRPHRMGMYTLQGTRASYDDERGIYVEGESKEGWEPLARYQDQYDHPWWRQEQERAKAAGHGGGDFFTAGHFFDCLHHDRQPVFDVYDAVTWSALIELSKRSIESGGAPQEFPDFTDGEWKTRGRHVWPSLV